MYPPLASHGKFYCIYLLLFSGFSPANQCLQPKWLYFMFCKHSCGILSHSFSPSSFLSLLPFPLGQDPVNVGCCSLHVITRIKLWITHLLLTIMDYKHVCCPPGALSQILYSICSLYMVCWHPISTSYQTLWWVILYSCTQRVNSQVASKQDAVIFWKYNLWAHQTIYLQYFE